MTYRISFAISFLLSVSVFLSGCERLSEKDKMDMIAKCDAEVRKKFEEKSELTELGSERISVETHYSFQDKQCYGLVKTSYSFKDGGKRSAVGHSQEWILFDGLTKKELLYAQCAEEECGTGGGRVAGPLLKQEGRFGKLVSFEEGVRMIQKRMDRP